MVSTEYFCARSFAKITVSLDASHLYYHKFSPRGPFRNPFDFEEEY